MGNSKPVCSFVFEHKGVPFLWALSQEGFTSCFRGEGQGERGTQLKIVCQGAIFWSCVSWAPSNSFLGSAKLRGDSVLG